MYQDRQRHQRTLLLFQEKCHLLKLLLWRESSRAISGSVRDEGTELSSDGNDPNGIERDEGEWARADECSGGGRGEGQQGGREPTVSITGQEQGS